MKYTAFLLLISLFAAISLFADKNPPLNVKVDAQSIATSEDMPLVSYAGVLGQATPSVVAVYTSRIVSARQSLTLPEFYRQFGRPIPRMMPEEGLNRERKERLGVGSGVIISADGYIVTNYHVVQGMRGREVDEILVRLNDGTEYVATLIGSDSKTDVAILKIEANASLPAVTLADSDLLRVGDIVFAIGNPRDLGLTATQGIVSALERNRGGQILGAGSYENFIQTDAAINLGNSGGALVDAWGRLVGINTAIVSSSGGSIGLGFAIPVNMVLNVATNLIKSGEVPRGMLGLFPDDLNREMADAFGLESTRGALVNQVQEDSPASRGGIRHGDIILKIDEREIDSAAELRLVVSQVLPGTKVAVTLIRQGKTMVLPITLGSLTGKVGAINTDSSALKGVILRPLDDDLRDAYSIPKDLDGILLIDVKDDSPFVDKLEPLTVIIEINGNAVNSIDGIEENLVMNRQNRFYIWADGKKRFVILKL
ncbi:MAG: Do family serine endopeptidase [Verrucomicrobiota bacterium]|nr:Do family serine endopeptidase [Verrucomicrobiota bacterium]